MQPRRCSPREIKAVVDFRTAAEVGGKGLTAPERRRELAIIVQPFSC